MTEDGEKIFKVKIKNNMLYVLLTKPNIYLKKLILRTLVIGFVSLFIGLLLSFFEINNLVFPPSTHSLIGIVIGLLLVFRCNTAYERWWEGRKTIGSISHEIINVSARLDAIENRFPQEKIKAIRESFLNYITLLHGYLKKNNSSEEIFYLSQKNSSKEIIEKIDDLNTNDLNVSILSNSVTKLIEYSNILERIKNTPIPISYRFHIRISILIYLLTLPFGTFHNLGLWGTPFVMLIYYIIAGVEIISNEIENPFADDPNDLPIDKLFGLIKKTLIK